MSRERKTLWNRDYDKHLAHLWHIFRNGLPNHDGDHKNVLLIYVAVVLEIYDTRLTQKTIRNYNMILMYNLSSVTFLTCQKKPFVFIQVHIKMLTCGDNSSEFLTDKNTIFIQGNFRYIRTILHKIYETIFEISSNQQQPFGISEQNKNKK